MKKITLIASLAMLCFANHLKGEEIYLKKRHTEKGCCRIKTPKEPFGSFYSDLSSLNPSQTVVLTDAGPPLTSPVLFTRVNANYKVNLSLNGPGFIVPSSGFYEIAWNASLSLIQSTTIYYHFDLQKNGITLLHPSPQASGQVTIPPVSPITPTVPFTSAAASVIVPLLKGDAISLLLTIDGSEGNIAGDGVRIESAQISATKILEICN